MKLYFSTNQIPALRDLPMAERLDRLRKAENKLTAPEKLLLNICKLLVIVPVFVFILKVSENWLALVWAGLFLLAYPLLLKPFQYSMCARYIPEPDAQAPTEKGNSQ